MMGGVLDYFPYSSPRSGQVECVEWLMDRIDMGEKYLIVDARTGFGKSGVARCLTDYFADFRGCRSFIFTSTKMLQEQYYRDACDFNRFGVVYELGKGRSNFLCNQSVRPLERLYKGDGDFVLGDDLKYCYSDFDGGDGVDCGDGVCTVLGDDFTCPYSVLLHYNSFIGDACEYLRMKYFTNLSDVALLNYDVKISDNVFTGGKNYDKRFLCVYDEAHNIEGTVLNYTSLSLPVKSLLSDVGFVFEDEFWGFDDVSDWVDVLSVLVDKYKLERLKIANKVKSVLGDKEDLLSFLKHVNNRYLRIKRIYNYIVDDMDNWVVVLDKFRDTVEFKPLNVDMYTEDYLFNSGRVHVFMSGSILNAERFCKDLGIPYNEDNVFTSEGVFDFKHNNPIIRKMVGSMNNSNVEQTKPLSLPVLKQIFNKHKDEKGLIHCVNKKLADYIMCSFKDTLYEGRLISYGVLGKGKYAPREVVVDEFKRSNESLILVSYSLEEGVDLPYDECRFQVFYKTPYLFLGDTRVREKKKKDPDWYMLATIRRFQQMYGRGMRSVDDFCVNYVLDTSMNSIFKHKMFPKYILEAIV